MTRDDSMAMVPYSPAQTDLLMPLATALEAQKAIAAYEAMKQAIMRPDDVKIIQGNPYLKKPFWRRVARMFGLSVELVREERLELDGKIAYRVIYRAIAPNGQSMDGDGMMTYGEKGQTIEHNIRAIAHTRAKNRAISDLVGGGEVSAEEMPDGDDQPRRTATAQPQQTTRTAPAPRPAPVRHAPVPQVEVEPRMTFVEAAQADADAVSDAAPEPETDLNGRTTLEDDQQPGNGYGPATAQQRHAIADLCHKLGKDVPGGDMTYTQARLMIAALGKERQQARRDADLTKTPAGRSH